MAATSFFSGEFFGGEFFFGAAPAPSGSGVGNNDFWLKGNRQIGQKRRWRYWWEKDPTDIPKELPVPEALEDIQAESNAVASHITDLVIQRAAEEVLRIMRAYYEILQEQILAKQNEERKAVGIREVPPIVTVEQKRLRRKKLMLLLG